MAVINTYRGTATGEIFKENATPSTVERTVAGTLQLSDWGDRIEYNISAPGNITLPPSMPEGWQCIVVQSGTGQLTFINGSGVSSVSYSSQFKTLGQWAEVLVTRRASNSFMLSGDLTA